MMLAMRLAYGCGRLDYWNVLDELSQSELVDWCAYGAVNGWFIPVEDKPEMTLEQLTSMLEKRYGNNNHS
jgi:hypothetical protein